VFERRVLRTNFGLKERENIREQVFLYTKGLRLSIEDIIKEAELGVVLGKLKKRL
jgi:hypothetical protein